MKIITLIVIALSSLVLSGCSIIGIQFDQSNGDQSNPNLEIITSQLDLSNKQLTKLPTYVLGLNNLEELNLSHNQLTGALPAEIKNLRKLKILNLSDNLMTGIPAEIGQMTNLQILNLANNQFTGLPNELGNLKNLKTLNLSGNDYSPLDLATILQNLPSGVEVITQ